MSLLVVGLSYRTAPLPLLERVTVRPDHLPALLGNLLRTAHVTEAMVLSTCNRLEVYADVTRFHGGVGDITELLAGRAGLPVAELGDHLYVHYEEAAVAHLFAVAAGLDSMVVGEGQILGQLREAYAHAGTARSAGRLLHEAVQQALRVGKRARTDTGIDRTGASVLSTAIELAERATGPLAGRPALVCGAGAMGALAVATLRRAGAGRIVVASRTVERARRLAAAGGELVEAVELDRIDEVLPAVDLVVGASAAEDRLLSADAIERAQKARDERPLALVDLALPHDIDPAAGRVPGVCLLNLESLREALAGGAVSTEVEAARAIVTAEVAAFLAWQRGVEVVPTVTALRARAAEVVDAELARLGQRLPDLDPAVRVELERTVRRTVSTLLHQPTVRVRELAGEPGGDAYAAALRVLFGLDPRAPEAMVSPAWAVEEEPR